jgi:hypothetical protein
MNTHSPHLQAAAAGRSFNLTANLKKAIAAGVSLALAGCSINPVVSWKPLELPAGQSIDLDYGYGYADRVRDAYRAEIVRQAGISADLNSGLVGLGALGLLAAASNAHRDAVAGIGLLGGTSYALGSMNLNRQRLLVLQAGVDAIGCAKKAVIPLAMPREDLKTLNNDLTRLQTSAADLDTQIAATADALSKYAAHDPDGTTPLSKEAKTALDAARAAAGAAVTAQTNGRALEVRVRQAGRQLVAAIDKIDGAIVRASLDTLPDLSSVPKVISGLAGFSAAIVPGSGLDAFAAGRLADRAKALTPKLVKGETEMSAFLNKPGVRALDEALRAQLVKLASATATVQQHTGAVQSVVAAYASGVNAADVLAECGVTGVSFPLKTTLDTLPFVEGTDAQKSVFISGGTMPYVVEVVDTPVDGITVKGPPPFETRVEVKVKAAVKAPQTVNVLVMDSSRPPKSQPVVIKVEKAPEDDKPADKSAGKTAAPPAKTAPASTRIESKEALVKALGRVAEFEAGKVAFVVEKRIADGARIHVSVSCKTPPPAAACVRSDAVRDALLAKAAPDGSAKQFAADVNMTGLPPECFCKP